MANIIPCNQIETEADRLKNLFEPCYQLKAEDLDALADLAYSASLCGQSSNLTNQNNIIRTLSGEGLSTSILGNPDPSFRVNGAVQFTVEDTEILDVINNYTINSGTSLILMVDYYFLKPGKGTYGIGSNNILTADDFLLYKSDVLAVLPSTTFLNPQLFEVYNNNIDNPDVVLNTEGPYILSNDRDTYFVISQNSESTSTSKKIYRFIGDEGTYGLNQTQFQTSDFILVEDLTLNSNGDTPVLEDKILIKELNVSASIIENTSISNIAEAVLVSFRGLIPVEPHTIYRLIATKVVPVNATNVRLDTLIYDFKNTKEFVNFEITESDFSYIETIQGQILEANPNENPVQIVSLISNDINDPSTPFNNFDTSIIVNNNSLYVKVSNSLSDVQDPEFNLYAFTGGNGTYGLGNTQVDNSSFLLIESLNDVLVNNNGILGYNASEDNGDFKILIGNTDTTHLLINSITGKISLPGTEISDITEPKNLVTKEYSDANYISPSRNYITLNNTSDLQELINIQNPQENDIAIINNYLNDVVTFRYFNNGWQRESNFNSGCGVRIDKNTNTFRIITDSIHAPIGVRDIITDPLGNESFQFAILCPNADNITGTFIGTADESDGLRGYTIGGSIGGQIALMRVSATNGFPIKVENNGGTISFVNDSQDNVPNSYFSQSFDAVNSILTISHPLISINKNSAPSIVLNGETSSSESLIISSHTTTSVSVKLNNIGTSPLSDFPNFTIYRNGTYIVPIDLLQASGNYIFTGTTRATERLYAVNVNGNNFIDFDQDFIFNGEFSIEFGTSGLEPPFNHSLLGNSSSPLNTNCLYAIGRNIFLDINGTLLTGASLLEANEFTDNYIKVRRDSNNDIYLKLNNNPETLMGNSSSTWTVNQLGNGSQGGRRIGYFRNLKMDKEYYNFSEQNGLTGSSVYNSGNNPRTFTITQNDLSNDIWIEL